MHINGHWHPQITHLCSIGLKNHTRSLESDGPADLIHFYNIGLDGYNGKKKVGSSTWTLRTSSSLTVRTFQTLYNDLDPHYVSIKWLCFFLLLVKQQGPILPFEFLYCIWGGPEVISEWP